LLVLLPVIVGLQTLRLSAFAGPVVALGWGLAPYLIFGVVFYFLGKGLAGWVQRGQAERSESMESAPGVGESDGASLDQDFELEKNRLLAIQEELRKKLARDLHDGPTQSVAALALRVNIARRTLEKDGQAAVEELVKVEDLARRTTKDIRHVLFLLRPLVFDSQGLVAALESLATMMEDYYKINIALKADVETAVRLEVSERIVLFYLSEEAVNVARKFAGANNILVRLRANGDGYTLLEVEDDGASQADRSVQSENGVSLRQILEEMNNRAQLVDGSLDYQAGSGQGNCLVLSIPQRAAPRRSTGQAA
jgi:signal transduction histidine kinase